MNLRRLACLAVALIILLIGAPASAENVKFPLVAEPEEVLRLPNGGTCRTAGGTDLTLDPGVVLAPAAVWEREDARLRALGDEVTGLRAENADLRKSASGGGVGWKGVLVIAMAVAAGAGVGLWAR